MTFIRNFITCIFSIIQISMRTIKILLMLLLTASQSALAFNQKTDTVIVTNDSCEIVQFIVTIDNTDSEALWIWLDSNDYGHDRKKAIRRYLMKRRGDFSIFDIGADPNMIGEWWHPSAPKYCFVKYLETGKTFTIVFYSEKALTPDYWNCKNAIDDIRVFSDLEINEYCPGLEAPYSIKRISYPHNVIAFPINADKLSDTISK